MKKNSVLVSIIVPVYNAELYLDKCVFSIINQTYEMLEVILVNDGSEDESLKKCLAFSEMDGRVKVLSQENKGLVAARKAGMEAANGKYCMHIDSDDWIESNTIDELTILMDKTHADFIQAGYWEEPAGVVHIYEKKAHCQDNLNKTCVLEKWFNGDASIDSQIWNKIYKTEFIKKCYRYVPDNCSYGEDHLLFLRVLKEMSCAYVIDKSYYHYLVRTDSMSHLHGISRVLKEENLLAHFYYFLKELFPELGEERIENYYYYRKLLCLKCELDNKRVNIPLYGFPEIKKLLNKKVVIYGGGMVGKDMYQQLCMNGLCQIVAWIDKNPEQCINDWRRIDFVDVICDLDFDYVLVAIQNMNKREEVVGDLTRKYAIPENKILWNYNYTYLLSKSNNISSEKNER